MSTWDSKGCPTCRQLWLTGRQPPKLAVNDERHSFLHRCEDCGTYWEQFERYADVVSEDEAKAIYGVDAVAEQEEPTMSTADFNSVNDLETALVDAKNGQIPFKEFLRILMHSDVHVSSATEVQADGKGFQPLLFDKAGGTLMAVFTARERATRFGDKAPFCLTINGQQLIQRVPENLGLVLNPGFAVGFEIPADGVQGIRRDFATT